MVTAGDDDVDGDDDGDDDDGDVVIARSATTTSYLKSMARPRVSNLVARVVRQQVMRRRYEVRLGEEVVAVPSNIHRSGLMSEIHQAGLGEEEPDWV